MKKTTKLILLSAFCGLSFMAHSQIPTNGLIGYWPFNGNANDQSGNNNNGTVNGVSLTTDRFGNPNSSYLFGGSGQYINLGSNSSLNRYNTDFTISAWINPSSLTASSYNNTIISNRGNVDNKGSVFAIIGTINNTDKGKLIFGISGGGGANADNVISANAVPLNAWTHVMLVYKYTGNNNNIATLYINGIKSNTDTLILNTPGPISQPTSVGDEPLDVANQHFTGKIDDIRIYSRTLNQTEINALYNEGVCYQSVTVTDTLKINLNTTGYNPITYANTIKIYPNPTSDKIVIDNGNISNLTGYHLKITNTLGQQVYQTAITQQLYNVDLTTFGGKGIYFVNVINPQGATIDIKKIVLQ